jgi:hypothetical protein
VDKKGRFFRVMESLLQVVGEPSCLFSFHEQRRLSLLLTLISSQTHSGLLLTAKVSEVGCPGAHIVASTLVSQSMTQSFTSGPWSGMLESFHETSAVSKICGRMET